VPDPAHAQNPTITLTSPSSSSTNEKFESITATQAFQQHSFEVSFDDPLPLRVKHFPRSYVLPICKQAENLTPQLSFKLLSKYHRRQLRPRNRPYLMAAPLLLSLCGHSEGPPRHCCNLQTVPLLRYRVFCDITVV
jgi:hypothetical protein